MTDLSVVIVNFNTKKLLRACLSSVFGKTKGITFEVLVVDNGSTDGSVAMVEEGFPQATLIENKKNLGFAKANNQGIKKAKGEYILLLNSDTKLSEDAFSKLIRFARTKENLAIAGPKLLDKDGTPQASVAPFYSLPVVAVSLFRGDRFLRRSPAKACQVDWVSGACFLIKKKSVKKIGPLDEKFFMYVEEMEYCYRAKRAGFSVWFYPGAQVHHLVRGSSEGRQKAIWWIYQGLILFYQKHFASWQTLVLKFLLQTKAVGAWLVGVLTANTYLKKTYAKAFKLVR